MRAEFTAAFLAYAKTRPDILFLTGDLGYMALEEIQTMLGSRFINAGVAEQNMMSVAAGLAAMQFKPWVYSIAPFATLRPYEQIRNDICMHRHPVKIVGNGGGYGYGIMGGTHHVLQDIGLMRMLPHMQVYVPLFKEDVAEAVVAMGSSPTPGYLRLNLAYSGIERPGPFCEWRQLTQGDAAVVISTGPVVADLLNLTKTKYPNRFDVWSLGILPFGTIPEGLLAKIRQTRALIVLEEHTAAGGVGELVAAFLLGSLPEPIRFKSLHAKGYPSGRYGSQRWHQEENALAGAALDVALHEFINEPIAH